MAFVLFSLGTAVSAFAENSPRKDLFISVIQDPPVLTSRQAIQDLVHFSKTAGIDTLYVQVYRENKAWFASEVGDDSLYQKARETVGEDPFALLIHEAKAADIEVHAWVNLLSLGANEKAPLLKKYGERILTRNTDKKNSLKDYKIDNQFFLEPGDPKVRDAMEKMVEEVVTAYPELDGIQFDYIRYPDWKPAYGRTPVNEKRYKKAAGQRSIDERDESWKKWKCNQVTKLVRLLKKKAVSINPAIRVTTTGLVPYSRARHEAYQDWKYWVESGLIEYVTLMAYTDDTAQFEKYLKDARIQLGSLEKANIAVAAYKLTKNPAGFREQWSAAEKASPRSIAVFHYGDLLENSELSRALSETQHSHSDL